MREFLNNRWVGLFGFILVIVSITSLYLWPQAWLWILLPPIVLWGLKLVFNRSLFHQASIVWLLVFVFTAAVGYWAAYDATAAWNKFCLIIASVVFYSAIVGQPEENLKILAGFWFVVGVGIATYFLLTFDFAAQTVKFQFIHQMGIYWTRLRPISFRLPSIHPNDAAGLSIIMSAYGLFLLGESQSNNQTRYILRPAVLTGLAIVLFAVVLSSSRGALLALAGSTGIWIGWRVILLARSPLKEKLIGFFPSIVMISLLLVGIVVLALPLRLLGSSFPVGENVSISRSELIRSGLWILHDFPFTGGGLNSFPGLYSQYILVIPYYSILNSHNMFLDVMIEQGILGGISFLCIYLIGGWKLLVAWQRNRSHEHWGLYAAVCISLFTAILHGMVDDYIYGGRGTVLALIPAGMALLVSRFSQDAERQNISERQANNSQPGWFRPKSSLPWPKAFVFIASMAVLLAFMWNSLVAQWYANIGSVKMAKVDLANYPSNRWYDGDQVDRWLPAEKDFRRALAYQANNRTANHRLGLIRLIARDFESASDYLLRAYERDSTNRGVTKNLGYSYVWLGETDEAQSFLARIPEAKNEMDVYVWWWGTQDRGDLAEHADAMLSRLEPLPSPQ